MAAVLYAPSLSWGYVYEDSRMEAQTWRGWSAWVNQAQERPARSLTALSWHVVGGVNGSSVRTQRLASLALHHVRTADRKRQLYRDCHAALGTRGLFITADCCPSADEVLAAIERAAWREHLRLTYSDQETEKYFAAWAEEDVYVPLSEELAFLKDAGFMPDVVWRQGPFAVLAARRM